MCSYNEYMNNILSLTLNHHTKYVYIYLSNEILHILNIKISPYPEEFDPKLNIVSIIIYESVKNVINKELKKKYIFSKRIIKC